MINTIDFRTRTVMLDTRNAVVDDYWSIALDIGYSSVKGFSPNSVYAFPAYAKNLGKNPSLFGEQQADEILYRDGETGEVWRVGRSAQQMIDERDTSDSQAELFGRDRYFSPMFKVILRTGIGLGMLNNSLAGYNGKPLFIQTGLPPAYLEEDREYMLEVIKGKHRFAVKTARMRSYVNLELDIREADINVMSQPEGTLMNLVMDDRAKSIPEAKRFMESNILIFDAGFGTLDLFDILNRNFHFVETFSEYGMRRVLEKTSEKIRSKMGVVLRPSAMQNSLEKGAVKVNKRKGMQVSSTSVPFADLLEEASAETCREAVEKLLNIYSGLVQYDCLILTGGTSAAWEGYIRDYLKDIESLEVVMGNVNCPDMDLVFCNVRGYYMYRVSMLRKLQRQRQQQRQGDRQ